MNKFKIKQSKSININPDTVIFNVDIDLIRENILYSDNVFSDIAESLRADILNMINCIEQISDECRAEFAEIEYNYYDSNDNGYTDIVASTYLVITCSELKASKMREILEIIVTNTIIKRIDINFSITNMDKEKTNLVAELCKECKNDVDIIAQNLNCKIKGTKLIKYDADKFIIDDAPLSSSDNANIGLYDNVWIDTVVSNILDYRIILQGTIKIVFELEEE